MRTLIADADGVDTAYPGSNRGNKGVLFPALRLLGIYTIVGVLWILVSDTVLLRMVPDPHMITSMQTYKGWAFVLASGLLIYYFLIRELRGRMQAEESLGIALEAARMGYWDLDVVENRTRRSIGHDRIFGYQKLQPEWNYEVFLKHVLPEDRGHVAECFSRALVCGDLNLECRIRWPDQTTHWIVCRGRAYCGADGRLVRVVGVVTDATERKKAEQALKESEERLRLAWETSPDALGITRMEDGTYIDVNNGFTVLSGYSREEVVGKSSLGIPIWHDSASRQRFVSCVLTDGYVKNFEAKMRRKDGKLRTVLMSAGQMTLNGEPHMFSVGQEVEELYEAAEALRASEEKYRNIFENAVEGIFQSTLDGRLISVNPAYAKMFGYSSPEEMIRDVTDLARQLYARPGDRDEFKSRVEGPGRLMNYEAERRRKDGTTIWVSINARSVRDAGGKVLYYEGTIEEITARKRVEQELAKSEALLKAILDASPVGIALVRNRRLQWANRALYDLFGYDPDEIQEADVRQFYMSDDDYRRTGDALYAGIAKGEVREIEMLFKHRGGTSFPCILRATMTDDCPGDLAVIAVFMDITERKQAEEALKESEAWYRSLVEESFDGILVRKGTQIVYANSVLHEMLGYAEREMEGIDHWLIYHPDYREAATERAAARTRGEILPQPIEVKLQRKDGSHFDGEINARAVTVEGEPGARVWVKDVSKRKRLEEVQRRLATAIEQSAEAVVITDRRGHVEYVNPAHQRITGYSREEVIGSLPPLFNQHDMDPKLRLELSGSLARGATWSGRAAGRRKDGTLCEMDITISPVRDSSGRIVNLVGVERDITEEVRLQKQLLHAQKMEAIGTFTGGIAHDFNNLLQVMLGYSELLLAEKQEADGEYADLQKISHAAKDGAELVRRLLMFSRKTDPTLLSINLNKQIVQVEELLRCTIPKMIEIRLDLSSDLPEINADPSQIEQVLMNLVLNARDAMPDAGQLIIKTDIVTLDEEYCRLRVDVKPGEYALLEVSDTGHGMDKETLEHIFEPFFTTKEIGRGTGLGLAMVYGTVKQHNGHISVYSEVGRGTTFKVYFPAIPGETEPQVDTSGEMQAFGTETVLLVDDEEFIRELGARILTKHGYTVLQAEEGREALDLFTKERSKISLVILDLIMPGMGGTECLKELLKIAPHANVLAASGYSGDASVRETIQMGAKGFVSKPFRVKELLRAVRRVLDES